MSAQIIDVSNELELNQAIATVDGATSGNFIIQFTADITEGTDTGGTITFNGQTLSAPADLYALNLASGVTLTINGGGYALSGASTYRGIFAYAGAVTIDNLTIELAVAQGGDGFQGGGGGAGLGGGLFVGSGANVTLTDVLFLADAAIGGNGGSGNTSGAGGGGGGLGGNAGYGGGGVGLNASGGLGPSPGNSGSGGYGIVLGTDNGGGGGNYIASPVGGYGGGIGANDGAGGFGGGGGGQQGFAGGGGFGGGGGGGKYGGQGGFGGGGGGGTDAQGQAGFGAGIGSNTYGSGIGAGGGGLGAGGAIFVQEGGTLTIGAAGIVGGSVQGGGAGGAGAAGGAAFGSGIFIQGDQTIILAPGSGQSLEIADDITDESGSGGSEAGHGGLLIQNGRVQLTGTNTYTGGTTIDDGATLAIGDFDTDGSIIGDVVDDGTLVFGRADTVTFSGAISGSGGLSQEGNGTLVLDGDDTYTGVTTIAAGTLQIAGGLTTNLSGDIVDDSTLVVTNSLNLSGTISGTGTVIAQGGDVILDGVNSYSGDTTIDSGILELGNAQAAGTGFIDFASGSTGILQIDDTVTTPVNPIVGFGYGDAIVLSNFHATFATPEGNGWLDIVDGTTGNDVELQFAGNVSNQSFVFGTDGNGSFMRLAATPTVIFVNSEAALNQAIADVDAATSGAYTIRFTADITEATEGSNPIFFNGRTLSGPTDLYALNLQSGVTLTIDGEGHALQGSPFHSAFLATRGFLAYAGAVTIQNLTIRNTLASGGYGFEGGGGGAGLGGGLFVGSGAQVTLSNVSFYSDWAFGAKGGYRGIFSRFGGGGGGLGGSAYYAGGGVGAKATALGGGGPGNVLGAGPGGYNGYHNGGWPYGFAYGGPGDGDGQFGIAGGDGAGGGGVNGQPGIFGVGGAGGFGGGGGGSQSGPAGAGGFGGGGGASLSGAGGNGGFGGGGGAGLAAGLGGFGAGSGDALGGGGGLGAGGDIFVQQGGTLSITGGEGGAGYLSGGQVAGGAAGDSGPGAGSALGNGIFIQGNQSITFAPDLNQVLNIYDDIADQSGSGGTGASAGAGKVVLDGAGTLTLAGYNTYSGGTTIVSGTLNLASPHAAGTGPIIMDPGTIEFSLDDAPTNEIDGFGDGDALIIDGFVEQAGTYSSDTLTLQGTDASGAAPETVTLHLPGLHPSDFAVNVASGPTSISFGTNENDVVACYCRGTLIETKRGAMRIEDLKIGDLVLTASGVARPIKWIGRRSYGGRYVIGRTDILPICIKAGALRDDVPKRDLWISPHHAMYFEDEGGLLIEAKDLVNGISIVQAESVERVEYLHIELDSHDVILANGAASESFIDDDSRGMFHNAHEYHALYPREVAPAAAHYCAPRLEEGYEVEIIRRRIAARAGLLPAAPRAGALSGFVDRVNSDTVAGWAQDRDRPEAPVCLDIFADGRLIGQVLANRYREDLERAGVGDGRHAFNFVAPKRAWLDRIEIRRSLDGIVLPLSASAMR